MRVDFLIMGAGMAGTALGSQLALHAKVLVLDKGPSLPLATRGWSCGLVKWGDQTPLVRELCALSVPLLRTHGLHQYRPFLYAAAVGQKELLLQRQRVLELTGETTRLVSQQDLNKLLPLLREDYLDGGLLNERVHEVNARALQAGLTQQAQLAGCQFMADTQVLEARYRDGRWRVKLANGTTCEATVLINAAGVQSDYLALLCGVAPKNLITNERRHFLLPVHSNGTGEKNAVIAGIDGSYSVRTLDKHICLTSSSVPFNNSEDAQIAAQRTQIELAYSIYQLESVSRIRARFPVSSWVEHLCSAKDGEYVVGWDSGDAPFFWFTAFGDSALQGALGAAKLAMHDLLGTTPSVSVAKLRGELMRPEREMRSAGEWRVQESVY